MGNGPCYSAASNGGDPDVKTLAGVFTALAPSILPGRVVARRRRCIACFSIRKHEQSTSAHQASRAHQNRATAVGVLKTATATYSADAAYAAHDTRFRRTTPHLHFRRPHATVALAGGRSHSRAETERSGPECGGQGILSTASPTAAHAGQELADGLRGGVATSRSVKLPKHARGGGPSAAAAAPPPPTSPRSPRPAPTSPPTRGRRARTRAARDAGPGRVHLLQTRPRRSRDGRAARTG